MDFHPSIVHFAIAMPVIALILQILAVTKGSEVLSKSALNMLFFSSLALIGAWFTGGQQGPEIYPFLSEDGQKLLIQHRNVGIGIGLGFAILTAVKMLSIKKGSRTLEIAVTILLFVGVLGNLSQGKTGGELVYQYGAGVECPEEDDEE